MSAFGVKADITYSGWCHWHRAWATIHSAFHQCPNSRRQHIQQLGALNAHSCHFGQTLLPCGVHVLFGDLNLLGRGETSAIRNCKKCLQFHFLFSGCLREVTDAFNSKELETAKVGNRGIVESLLDSWIMK